MGTLGGSDPGSWPPDGSLPGLPPGWGPIVVPDDAAELAEEADRVRFELRRQAKRRRWDRRLRPLIGADPAARLPALVALVALVALLTGLFSLGNAGRPNAQPTGSTPGALAPPPGELPALDLLDGHGRAVSVRSLLPAVVLLTDGCTCGGLISASAAAAPPGVSIVVVGRSVPALPMVTSPGRVRPLADPAGGLRSLIGLPASGPLAGVMLVAVTAEIARTLPAAASVEEFRADIDRLALR